MPASGAHAQAAAPAYVDAGLGQGHLRTRCDNTLRCERESFGLLLGAGLELPVTLSGGKAALELRWLQTGSYVLASSSLRVDLKAYAPMLGLAWWQPLAPAWTVGIGAGAALMSVEAQLTPAGGQAAQLSDWRTQPYGMAALQWAFAPATRLQATLLGSRLRFSQPGIDLQEGRLWLLTLGISRSF